MKSPRALSMTFSLELCFWLTLLSKSDLILASLTGVKSSIYSSSDKSLSLIHI